MFPWMFVHLYTTGVILARCTATGANGVFVTDDFGCLVDADSDLALYHFMQGEA